MAKKPATPFHLQVLPSTREVCFDPLYVGAGGTFSVRAGMGAQDSIAIASQLLASAESVVSEHLGDGLDEWHTYLVAFALCAARSIHSALGIEP